MRAVHNSKAYPIAVRATPPVTRLTLSGTTIKGKRHESVMSSVMNGTCLHRGQLRNATREDV